ncbi:thioredoxin domain-containing protein [Cellulomonas sp. URHD0024]|uniref:DsbA family protein n=1 Tax=Cellulomonas sp. URHD0024 TaxID=1302620 RepID=UPI0004084B07|nr:thioredoxin domain-containing protein [Cellulomonas sp. URHD0024]
MPTNEPRPTKAVRRDEARAKALQMRKEQERKAKRNRIIGVAILVAAVLGLGFVVWTIVSQQHENETANSEVVYGGSASDVIPPKLADVKAPSTAGDNGGIPVSNGGADVGKTGDGDVVLSIYFDFMCPVCGEFEKINGADLDTILGEGGTTVDYHPVAILDYKSAGSNYSTRTANAAAVVADKDPKHFTKFVTELYKNQPQEGSAGLTDEEIAKVATDLGVPKDVADTFTDTVDGTYETGTAADPTSHDGTWRTFAPWVAAATQQFGTVGQGTPTVLIDGKVFKDWSTPGALLEAVNAAKS